MKILLVGDFKSNAGPATVNKQLKDYFKEKHIYLDENTTRKKIIALVKKIRQVDIICFSGISKLNLIGILLSKIFRKKIAYLMHGYEHYEQQINGVNSLLVKRIENYMLQKSNMIICVSEYFMNFLKSNKPNLKNKISFVNNGINISEIIRNKYEYIQRDRNTILSVGGGMPRKNILTVCQAIEKINKNSKENLKLIVIGKGYSQKEEICNFDFVEFIDKVDYKEMHKYYQRAQLYIQNSIFETFGLAVLESLFNGCDLIISKNVGAKDIFEKLNNTDVIENAMDIEEIIDKILKVLNNSNNQRLVSNINLEKISIEASATNLENKLYELKNGKKRE